MVDGAACYAHRILDIGLRVDFGAYAVGEHLELVDGGGAVDVACHEQRAHVFLGHKLFGELA